MGICVIISVVDKIVIWAKEWQFGKYKN